MTDQQMRLIFGLNSQLTEEINSYLVIAGFISAFHLLGIIKIL
jgi:hypothetical protein